jgi:hypothetical protein
VPPSLAAPISSLAARLGVWPLCAAAVDFLGTGRAYRFAVQVATAPPRRQRSAA